MMIARPVLCVWAVTLTVAVATPALAQRGRPAVPPGQAKKGQQAPATSSSLVSGGSEMVTVDGTRVRALGAWLDDATVLTPGETWLALSASRWALPIASGADAPVLDLSVGIAKRVQTSVSLPYFRAAAAAGQTTRGVGDVYVTTKVVLHEVKDEGIGIAISPTAEILSQASSDGTSSRARWVLPVNVERRFASGRVYGSTGLFSRGAFFVSAAAERYITEAMVVSAAVTNSYSIDEAALSDELGLGRRRLDASGTVAYTISPAMSVFGSLGRTVWGMDPDSTRLIASGGVSVKVR